MMVRGLLHQAYAIGEGPDGDMHLTEAEKAEQLYKIINGIVDANTPLHPKSHGLSSPLTISLKSYPP